MTVRVYRWDDAGAPVLDHATGGRVPALMKACLVTGYGVKAGAGWSNPFSGTNVEVFRNGAGSSQLYLRVTHAAATVPRVVGYESMTDADTGTAPFPTEAQAAGGLYVPVSVTTNNTERPWILVATEKACYLWIGFQNTTAQGLTSTTYQLMYFFGDIRSSKVGDGYSFAIIANTSNAVSTSQFGAGNSTFATTQGHYIARPVAQVGGATAIGKIANYALNGGSTIFGVGAASVPAYPDPATGGMLLSDVRATDSTTCRGVFPALWVPLHNMPGACGDTFSGRGLLNGKTFMLLDCSAGTTRTRVALEISDTW